MGKQGNIRYQTSWMVVTPSLVLELLLPLLVLLPIAAVLRCVPSSRRRNQ